MRAFPHPAKPSRTLLSRTLALLLLGAPSVPLLAAAPPLLLPAPREYQEARRFEVKGGVNLICAPCTLEDSFAVSDLKDALRERGVPVLTSAHVAITFLRVSDPRARHLLSAASIVWATDAMDAEGYVILPSPRGISVVAASSSGIFYGAQTVKQLIDSTGQPASLQVATIRDWPALKVRGLSDDLSRGSVPTLAFLKNEIRTLAAYKVNLYSPYFEHTQQYRSAPLLAPPFGSISRSEAKELVAYAAAFHVAIAPEQEAFGHLHNLLNWEIYAPLAETPHGQVLAPAQPGSLALSKQLLTELADIYPGPYLHMGADETEELGKGQSRVQVAELGLGATYLDFLQKLVAELEPLHRKLLFWGDIAVHDPQLLKTLPAAFKANTIAVVWEYDPRPQGYEKSIRPFNEAGIECWVSPGVSSWARVYPNFGLALPNIQQLTAEGQARGCTGQMNTVWNDDGEALINSDWYGILFGAAAAWQPGVSSIETFQRSFGRVFHGDATGKIDAAQKELMASHAVLKDNFKRSDASDLLFWADPWSVDGQRFARDIRPFVSELRLHAERAIVFLREARDTATLREADALDAMELGARRMDLLGFKFQLSDEIASFYAAAERFQASNSPQDRAKVGEALDTLNSTNGKLQDLRDGYTLTRALYEQAWLRSYRPYWLGNNLGRYDASIQLWLARIDKVRAAQRQWNNEHTLPPASAIGIPPPAPGATP